MPFQFAPSDAGSLPLYVLEPDGVSDWCEGQDARVSTWVKAAGFAGAIGTAVIIPDADGTPYAAVAGFGTKAQRARTRFTLAAAVPALGEHCYHLATGLDEDVLAGEALGWLLTEYAFARYRDQEGAKARLVAPSGVDAAAVETQAQAEARIRDLINTPASDMGPSELEVAVTALAETFGATLEVVRGEALLEKNFPMIHAVGRASDDAPRLMDMRWGDAGPKITLVGKGVCFDTGGLNLKPGSSMGLMKKDMGGAANVIGLAHMIMASGLPVQLRVLIPAVENAVSGNSFRPQDILTSRKGLTVEINNTDAEGRLVLADALAYADEEEVDLILSMATLTGAARVAVGPDLAPYFTDASDFSAALEGAAGAAFDPVWRMPFHEPYETMIEPGIADLDNAPSGGFGGAITAALFLRRFATATPRYAHFDIYGWQPSPAPGRTKGGFGQGPRAIYAALTDLFDL